MGGQHNNIMQQQQAMIRQQFAIQQQQRSMGGVGDAAGGQIAPNNVAPNSQNPALRPPPQEPPKPREKKLLFNFNKDEGKIETAAKTDWAATKPDSNAPKPSQAETIAAAAPTAAASHGKAADSDGRGDRANTGPGTPRREQVQGGAHGNQQRNQSASNGKVDVANAGAVASSAENVGEAEGKLHAPSSKRGAAPGAGRGGGAGRQEIAPAPAPAAVSKTAAEKPSAPEKHLASEKTAAAEKAAGSVAKKVLVDDGKAAPAAPQPAAPKTAPAAQPAPVAAKAPAQSHEASKFNGEPEKGVKAEVVAPPAEPKVSASAKKEESSHQDTAKEASASVSTSDKNVTSIEPSVAPSPTDGSTKELPKAVAESAPVVAKTPASDAPAAKPVEVEASVEAAQAAEPAAPPKPSKPPREPKPRPVLKEGERLEYEIDFILKFKMLMAKPESQGDKEYGEGVKRSAADKMSNVGGRPGAGTMPGGGYQQGILPGPGGRGGAPMPMGRDQRGPPGRDQGRGGASGMRDRGGPPRGGGGRGQPSYQLISGPVKPLDRSDNAFDPGKNQSQTAQDKVMKDARSTLNKLTLTNFDKLSIQIAMLDIKESHELRGLVGIIFDKALEEGHFCEMYAMLCNAIKDKMPEFQEDDPVLGETKLKKVTFKRCLLNKCQEEFERADRYDETTDQEVAGMNDAAKAAKSRRVRIRMLGNVKFIGELFRQEILNEKIMHDCVKRLLSSKDQDTIECLCKLMATIGKQLDRKEAKHYMDYYFEQMQVMANESTVQRLKFMILDTLDLRKNRRWVPRREAPGPKTIEQIRALAAKEGIVAGPIPPPRGGPMMDPRGGNNMRGGMMGGGDPRDRRMGGGPPHMQQMGGGGRMMDDRMGGRNMGPPDAQRNMGPAGYGQGGNSGRPGGMGGDRNMGPPGGGFGGGGPAGRPQQQGGQGGQQAPAAHAPKPEKQEAAKPKLTVDQMEKRITSTLQEYVEIKQINEVLETLKELPSKECFSFVNFKCIELCCDTPSHMSCLIKLMGELYENKTLSTKELEAGLDRFLECLEDVAIDIPEAPKIACAFMIHGVKDKYLSWDFAKSMSEKYIENKDKFLGQLLSTLFSELGAEHAPKAWREAGVAIGDFGIKDEAAFIKEYSLGKLFPSEEIGKLMSQLIESSASNDDIIAEIEKAAAVLECNVDRDMSRMLVRYVLKKTVAELGGAEALQALDTDVLIVQKEKELLEGRKTLLKNWLEKESDQAFALFEVQKCAQDMEYPKGFLSRMLATLYDLEVLEEGGVKDWLSPPDNRHPFLKQAKDAFKIKDNVEAKKQAQKFMDWLESEN